MAKTETQQQQGNATTKRKKYKNNNKPRLTGEARFESIKTDPRYLPISKQKNVVDERMKAIFSEEFITGGNREEKYLKDVIKDIYNVTERKTERDRVKEALDEVLKENAMQDDDEDNNIILEDDDEGYRTDEDEGESASAYNKERDQRETLINFEMLEEEEKRAQMEAQNNDPSKFVEAPTMPGVQFSKRAIEIMEKQQKRLEASYHVTEKTAEEVEQEFVETDPQPMMPTIEASTARLSVNSFDWRVLRPEDIFVLMNSVVPDQVRSVTFYLSKFGKEMLELERTKGFSDSLLYTEEERKDLLEKQELFEKHRVAQAQSRLQRDGRNLRKSHRKLRMEKSQEHTLFHPERLKEYEMKRLSYYYAVVEFTNSEAADRAYSQLDDVEIENSGIVFDLRYIPDTISFADKETLYDRVESMPSVYQPKTGFWNKTHHNEMNPHFTWDENDPQRDALVHHDRHNLSILKSFLAVSDSEDEEEEEKGEVNVEKVESKNKLRALLDSIQENEHVEQDEKKTSLLLPPRERPAVQPMEDDEESSEEDSEEEEEGEIDPNETKWQRKERERKRKRKLKRLERKRSAKARAATSYSKVDEALQQERVQHVVDTIQDAAQDEDEFDARRDFDKEMTRRRLHEDKQGQANESDLAASIVEDDRFKELVTNSSFTQDPTHKRFQKSKVTEMIAERKRHRVMDHPAGAPQKKIKL